MALPIDPLAKQVREHLPTSSPKLFDLSAPDANVKKVQSALKDAGLYMGVVDGRFNQDTESAILKYQNREGLPLNPIASKELVKHIQSTKQVDSLLKQLQIQRLHTMEEARKALLTRAETRDIVFSPVYKTSQVSRDNTTRCFLSPTTECLLDHAFTSASTIFKNEQDVITK